MRKLNTFGFTTHKEVGDWYDNKFTEMGGSWYVPPDEINDLLDRMGYPEDSTGTLLLELGCGDGKLLYEAAKRGGACAGVDISAVARRMSLERCNDLIVLVFGCPMEDLEWEDGHFDFVISYGSMEHSLDIPKAVSEMARVLKPSGRFLNYAPNEEWIHEDQPLETTMTAEEWTSLLQSSGLVVDSVTKIGDNNIYVGHKSHIKYV